MKVWKALKKVGIVLIITVITLTSSYYIMSPLNQSDISLAEKKIIRKYGTLRSTGKLTIYRPFKAFEDKIYYTIEINPKGEFTGIPFEVIVAFDIFLYLENNMEKFNQLDKINSEYNGNLLLEGSEIATTAVIEKKDYLSIKKHLRDQNIELTSENLAIYWVEENYYNRNGEIFIEKFSFLDSMATIWNKSIYNEKLAISVIISPAQFDRKNKLSFFVSNENNDCMLNIEDVERQDFVGVMFDYNMNVWLFYRSRLEIYSYLENEGWSEKPTNELPDKSVIPKEIAKAYEYIYNKKI